MTWLQRLKTKSQQKQELALDRRFLDFVTKFESRQEFESIVESGYLCFNQRSSVPAEIDEIVDQTGFEGSYEFLGALVRWVRSDPDRLASLQQKSQLRRSEADRLRSQQLEGARKEREEQAERRRVEFEERQRLEAIAKTEALAVLRANYLSDRQMMIADALKYRDLIEKLERCKRRSSRRKWKSELSHDRFAQFLKFSKLHQDDYRSLVLSGVFDRKGIDYESPGILYLTRHPLLGALKIGISSNSSAADRILAHQLRGWNLEMKWDFLTTRQAFQIEQRIICWWRDDLELGNGVSADQMPQGGFSETVPFSEELLASSIAQIRTLMESVTSHQERTMPGGRSEVALKRAGCWCGGAWKTRANRTSGGTFVACSRWPYCSSKPGRLN